MKIGDSFLRKNSQTRPIVVNRISGFEDYKVICEIWTTDGLVSNTWYPAHHFQEENEFIPMDFDTAISQLVPRDVPIVNIESSQPNWHMSIVEHLKSGHQDFSTSSLEIKELIESAAMRIGIKISVRLLNN